VWHEKQVQARFFLSVDAQKTGTGNAVVAVPVPAFCAGRISEKNRACPCFSIYRKNYIMKNPSIYWILT